MESSPAEALDPLEERRVRLAGTLEVPPRWGDVRCFLDLRPPADSGEEYIFIRRMTKVESGLFRWEAGKVVPGRHRACVLPFQMQFFIEVKEAGNDGVRIRIPEPADVVVAVLDKSTGQPALSTLLWTVKPPPGSNSNGLSRATRDPKTGTFKLRVPVGVIRFVGGGEGGYRLHEERTVRLGRSEFTFSLERRAGIQVVLKDGETAVRCGWSAHVWVEQLDGDGISDWNSGNDFRCTFWVTQPGRYMVTFRGLNDYKPIAPRTVAVPPSKTVTLDVPLDRR